MIELDEFKRLVAEVIGDDLEDNPAQNAGICHDGNDILMLVAGPGSGKTRVLVIRALRHVLVDDILPEEILITTFTRKAAKELRSRWLEWGTQFLESLSDNPGLPELIERIDLNRCRIDTLDSIAQQALTENRIAGEVAPIVLEASAAKLILKRASFGPIYSEYQDILDQLLSRYTFSRQIPRNRGEALNVTKSLCDRLVQDLVNLDAYRGDNQPHQLIVDILTSYQDRLRETNLYDFAFLELRFLERLRENSLEEWTDNIEALLIDEYQDTNPLQEAIYFELITQTTPRVTVVGDDDQAMYRFRGGSVELFTQFGDRCERRTGRQTRRVDMVTNYRSSDEIVRFYNSHIRGDVNFAPARIVPAKPEVISNRGELGMPILGLFRPDRVSLAESLADWINNLVINRQVIINDDENTYELRLTENGDLGDFVFLSHSVQETKYNHFNGDAEIRFAGHFRNALENMGLNVFNPRGQALRTIMNVQRLLGLLLLCLDPDGNHVNDVYPTNEARYFLNVWRTTANDLLRENPNPSDSGGISGFVEQWQMRSRGDVNVPNDWPILELIFKLITWIPDFQINPEHQVWLEAITRVVSSAGMASAYGMQIFQIGVHRDRSRQSFIRDALLPIAENEVEVDEDILPSVPRNYLQVMTIHQSKGLQFPLVIVDVGSHFRTNSHFQRFLRFPDNPSNVVLMEDDIEPFLNEALRGMRTPINRTFDDLVRLYYVAYSRPQSVILLVGCENCLRYGRQGSLRDGAIPNIALGWHRDGTWPWRQPFDGRRAPIQVNPPMLLL